MKLAEARAALAAALEAGTPAEVSVYRFLPDQVTVPALLIGWADPWFAGADVPGCLEVVAEVVAVAGRLDVADQSDRLDELVAAVALTIAVDAEWDGPTAPTSPFALAVAGVTYLAAAVHTSALVTLT